MFTWRILSSATLLCLSLTSAVAVHLRRRGGRGETGRGEIAESNDLPYDFYTFAQSWQPSFCYRTEFPGCANPTDFMRTHFTIHGLWPDRNDGSHPYECNSTPFDPTVVDKVGRDKLIAYWPNVKVEQGTPGYNQFWEHEWSKHGVCSGLTQETYMSMAIETLLKVDTPQVIQQAVGKAVSRDQLLAAYGGETMVALVCTKGGYLSEVRTCWSRNSQGTPVDRIECPESALHHSTCPLVVKIASF